MTASATSCARTSKRSGWSYYWLRTPVSLRPSGPATKPPGAVARPSARRRLRRSRRRTSRGARRVGCSALIHLIVVNDREAGGQERHRRIRARSPAGPVARAAIDKAGLAAHQWGDSGLPIPAFSQRRPCSGSSAGHNNFMLDNDPTGYPSNRRWVQGSVAMAFRPAGARGLRGALGLLVGGEAWSCVAG